MEQKWILYQTTNTINGKIYIGVHKTKDTCKSKGYRGSGDSIKAAIKKYGRDKFTRITLEEFESEEEAYLAESKVVTEEFVKREDNYNISLGGRGCIPTPEMTAKIVAWNKGRVFTEEHKANLRAAARNRVLSEETLEKLRLLGRSNQFSPETRAKISATSKGRKLSDETKLKLSIAKKGRPSKLKGRVGKPHTAETKAKLSEICKGRIATPETKAKISSNSPKNTPVVIGDVFYKSIAIASRTLEILDETISYRVKNNKPKWSEWRYATEEEISTHQM